MKLSVPERLVPRGVDCPSCRSRQQKKIWLLCGVSFFQQEEVLKFRRAGNWTQDFSHPKPESYPWTTLPLTLLRLIKFLKPYALFHSCYHEFVLAKVNDSSRCGLAELQISSASKIFDSRVGCHWFNSKVLKLGKAGNWTRDLSLPKQQSHP